MSQLNEGAAETLIHIITAEGHVQDNPWIEIQGEQLVNWKHTLCNKEAYLLKMEDLFNSEKLNTNYLLKNAEESCFPEDPTTLGWTHFYVFHENFLVLFGDNQEKVLLVEMVDFAGTLGEANLLSD